MNNERGGQNVVSLHEYTQANERRHFETYLLTNLGAEIRRSGTVLKIYHDELLAAMVMPETQNTSGFQEIIYRRYFAKEPNTNDSFCTISTAGWIRDKNGLILPDIYERVMADAVSTIDFFPNSKLQGDHYDNSFKITIKNRRGNIESLYDKDGNLEKADITVGSGRLTKIEDNGVVIFDNRPNYTIRRGYNSETEQGKTRFEASSNSERNLIFNHTMSINNILLIQSLLADTAADYIQIPTRLSLDDLKRTLFPQNSFKDPFNADIKNDASWRDVHFPSLTGISWRLEQHTR